MLTKIGHTLLTSDHGNCKQNEPVHTIFMGINLGIPNETTTLKWTSSTNQIYTVFGNRIIQSPAFYA